MCAPDGTRCNGRLHIAYGEDVLIRVAILQELFDEKQQSIRTLNGRLHKATSVIEVAVFSTGYSLRILGSI